MNGQGLLIVIDALGVEVSQKTERIAQLEAALQRENAARLTAEAELAKLKASTPTPS